MMNMRYMSMRGMAILLLIVVASAFAGEKRQFGYVGVVDSFDRSNGLLVVDDRTFLLPDDVKVFDRKDSKVALSRLRQGVKVGFYPPRGQGRRALINQIWVLPANWKVWHDLPVRLPH